MVRWAARLRSGPNLCAQLRMVLADTSICRSASRSLTSAAESLKLKYQRTALRMTSVGQRCRANGVYVRVVNVRRHAWQRKRWRPAGRRPSFFTLAVRQRGQCGILIPSQRKQYQQRGASLAHCNFAVSASALGLKCLIRNPAYLPSSAHLPTARTCPRLSLWTLRVGRLACKCRKLRTKQLVELLRSVDVH